MTQQADLVHQTSISTGTGNLTLAAVSGKRTFADAFGTGDTNPFDYFISSRGSAEWERGVGYMSDATTLVRDGVEASSNSNAAVNFSAGLKDVANDIPADEQVRIGDLAAVALTGAYGDLSGKPSLGDAAAKNTGTGAGTVAAGDDSRILGAFQQGGASLEVGHASDTTITRVAAGRIAVEGAELQKQPSANGLVARTSAGATSARTIAGTANQIAVSNGDGVSGNPTISATIASQGEAEAGTDTTKLMTPQRVSQAIAALAGVPTTLGAVGTYALLSTNNATGTVAAGSTIAGSSLNYMGFAWDSAANTNAVRDGSAPSGTWQAMGFKPARIANTSGSHQFTLFLRIS